MKASNEKIVEYAKELYLQVDKDGGKVHTWDSISKAILKKFKEEKHLSTVQKWSKKYDWAGTFEKIKMAGVEKAQLSTAEKENKIIDIKSDDIADIYKNAKQINNLSRSHIISKLTGQKLTDKSGNPINLDDKLWTGDLIRLMEHSQATLLNLHDKGGSNVKTIDLSSLSNDELLARYEAMKAMEKK